LTRNLYRINIRELPVIILDDIANGDVSQIQIIKKENLILPPLPIPILEKAVLVSDKLTYSRVNREDLEYDIDYSYLLLSCYYYANFAKARIKPMYWDRMQNIKICTWVSTIPFIESQY